MLLNCCGFEGLELPGGVVFFFFDTPPPTLVGVLAFCFLIDEAVPHGGQGGLPFEAVLLVATHLHVLELGPSSGQRDNLEQGSVNIVTAIDTIQG